jgi:hypothetical protein
VFFTPPTGAGLGFHNHQFSNPESRRASSACGSFIEHSGRSRGRNRMAVHMLTRPVVSSLFLILLAGTAIAGTPYDGVWDVTVETRAGSCDPSAQYRLTVQDGKISGPADIAGTVAHEGMVKVTLNGAYAFGQLEGKTGSGKWNAASAGKPCSGRWQATKE